MYTGSAENTVVHTATKYLAYHPSDRGWLAGWLAGCKLRCAVEMQPPETGRLPEHPSPPPLECTLAIWHTTTMDFPPPKKRKGKTECKCQKIETRYNPATWDMRQARNLSMWDGTFVVILRKQCASSLHVSSQTQKRNMYIHASKPSQD